LFIAGRSLIKRMKTEINNTSKPPDERTKDGASYLLIAGFVNVVAFTYKKNKLRTKNHSGVNNGCYFVSF